MTCIVGIDPGAKGAVAFLWPREGLLLVENMPVFKVTGSARTFTYVDGRALTTLFQIHKPSKTFLERVHSMPHDGPVGAFSFGENFGTIKGVHYALDLPFQLVEPEVWKANLKAPANKDESRERARALFPDCSALFTRPDKAEAAMIGLWGLLFMGIKPNRFKALRGVS